MGTNKTSHRQPPRPSIRVSLACAPCRSKHLRCDATTPACSRCHSEGKDCVYPRSRRGNRHHLPPVQLTTDPAAVPDQSMHLVDTTNLHWLGEESQLASVGQEQSTSESAMGASAHSDTPSDPSMPDLFFPPFYSFFHTAHPCILPHWAMKRQMARDSGPLYLLTSVMQYIGSVFAQSDLSTACKEHVEHALSSLGVVTGFDVQAILLYSIATYWGNEPKKALDLLDKAIGMALKLGMNSQTFASQGAKGDPVLMESWRRTWWQIYVTDAHIAGSTHKFPFRTSSVKMDVDLPCEEDEYESGNIPRPRTLHEYDMREFAGSDSPEFSSFAELVGLTRSLDLALASRQTLGVANAQATCANLDATVTAWRSMLPPSKKEIVRGDGSFDEILFKANMIIHTSIESVAHCAPPPPITMRGYNTQERQLHTAKVLRAIEQCDDLLTLPTNIAAHTPFIICMIANIVIAHLSACRFVFQGQQLKLARERVRLSMGALKVLSEYWPMGKRTYQEVGLIAREILGFEKMHTAVDSSAGTPPVGIRHDPVNIHWDPLPLVPDLPSLDANIDFCGLFDPAICD
ncbi:hypothetical protein BDV28DRAFT_155047 [Aspergillus coremiiformis]|uniref:Zn(2)-C6 fungal-type domain-containing protein n=1 Tax=Aspergillus coremiiformis TaxID=138285 RepID=A0A5N6ZE33_9EURO|nr:hypothetical protein BDV28DRAFT_155047 [Aspergillus coremiiformis]